MKLEKLLIQNVILPLLADPSQELSIIPYQTFSVLTSFSGSHSNFPANKLTVRQIYNHARDYDVRVTSQIHHNDVT